MLQGAERGRLAPKYRGQQVKPLDGLPFPRNELLDLRRYGLIKTFAVQTSRGCPFRCECCSERHHLGEGYRCRPVSEVVEEIKSVSSGTIQSVKKSHNRVGEYHEILVELRRRGIRYSLNFMFGWNGETMEVFRTTLDFLQAHKVPVAYFNVPTPHKGTPFYERMVKEGRITSLEEIGRYPGNFCHIKPSCCTPKNWREWSRNFIANSTAPHPSSHVSLCRATGHTSLPG